LAAPGSPVADAPARAARRRAPGRRTAIVAALGIALVAINLRTGITSVPPLLDDIRAALGLSATAAALLTALPVFCYGLLGGLAPALARRIGIDRSLALALGGVGAGLILRLVSGSTLLFAGTAVVGGALAIANVLLPALVKRDFAGRAGLMTGFYTTAMTLGATLGAAATVPVAHAIGRGWKGGLGFWAAPVLAAAVVTGLRRRAFTRPPASLPGGIARLVRDRRAWEVALFNALQAFAFYSIISWLPTIYRDHGYSATKAGILLGVAQGVGMPFGLIVPTLAARRPDQRAWVAVVTLVTTVGFVGILVAPTAAAWVWVVLIGFGIGAGFPLALTLVVLRTRTPLDTARLSALAQSIGYLIAATGPLILGALHDLTGSWTASMAVLVAIMAPQLAVGLAAGRRGYVVSDA
jgi:CP family cyanate transporter-like MFS transporter